MAEKICRSGGLARSLFGCLCAVLLLLPLVQAGALDADVADELHLSPLEPPQKDSVYGSFLAGMIAERRRDYGAAADFLIHALSAEPDNSSLLMEAFMLTAAEGRIQTAYALAERLQELGQKDVASLLLLAAQAFEQGEPQTARQLLSQQAQSGLVEITRPVLDAWLALAAGVVEGVSEALAGLKKERGLGPLSV